MTRCVPTAQKRSLGSPRRRAPVAAPPRARNQRKPAVAASKSWKEIGREGKSLLKDVVGKVASAVPRKSSKKKTDQVAEDVDRELSRFMGTDLMTKTFGSVFRTAFKVFEKTLRAGIVDLKQAYKAAASVVESSSEVRDVLGDDITCSAPYSQSSNTTVINGKKMTRLLIGFAATGSSGRRADVQVDATVGPSGKSRIDVTLPNGKLVNLSRPGDGPVIDVEAR